MRSSAGGGRDRETNSPSWEKQCEDWKKSQRAAGRAYERIQQCIADVQQNNERPEEGKPWGQFISSELHQRGIYGTAYALNVLSLGECEYDDAVQSGERWLRNQWLSEPSQVREEGERAQTYKHAWFINGLAPQESPITGPDCEIERKEEYEEFTKSLWDKRIEWENGIKGWGYYNYMPYIGEEFKPTESSEIEADEPTILPTAMSLYALLRSQIHYEKYKLDFEQLLLKLSEEAIENADRFCQNQSSESAKKITVKLALCLIVLGRYDRMDLSISEANDELQRVAEYLEYIIQENEIDYHSYTKDSFELSRSPYIDSIPFLPRPIITLAILEAGLQEPELVYRNRTYIYDSIKKYIDEIDTSGNSAPSDAYISKDDAKPALGDNFWIAICLFRFSNFPLEQIDRIADEIDEEGKQEGEQERSESSSRVRTTMTVFIPSLLIIGGIEYYHGIIPDPLISTTLTVVSSFLIAIIANLLVEVMPLPSLTNTTISNGNKREE